MIYNPRRLLLLTLTLLVIALAVVACAPARNTPQGQAPPDQNKTPAEKVADTKEEPEPLRRGCTACHVKKDDKDRSIFAKAVDQTKAGGGSHPTSTPDGAKMDENTTVDTCLQCHKPGNNGRAAMAPLMLRTILHPSHMQSKTFKEKYNGSCFTCHEVTGSGTFDLLSQKVDVNDKGIPDTIPIPGEIPPSEGIAIPKV